MAKNTFSYSLTANIKKQNFDPQSIRSRNLSAQLFLSAEHEPFENRNHIGSLAPSSGISMYIRLFGLLFGGYPLPGRT